MSNFEFDPLSPWLRSSSPFQQSLLNSRPSGGDIVAGVDSGFFGWPPPSAAMPHRTADGTSSVSTTDPSAWWEHTSDLGATMQGGTDARWPWLRTQAEDVRVSD